MDEALLLSFSDIEREHWWFATRRRIVENLILSDAREVTRILEVGCGTGYFMQRLAELFPGADITGIEPSAAAADVARSRSCAVEAGTLEEVSLPDSARVDLLVALDVLEHCPDDAAALLGAMRAMAPGARLVLTVPALPSLWSLHDEVNGHHRRYTSTSLRLALESAGFRIERMSYFNAVLLPIGYLTRAIARLIRSNALSGVRMPHPWINAVLRALFSLEIGLLRHGDLPIGMSLLAVASKPQEGAS